MLVLIMDKHYASRDPHVLHTSHFSVCTLNVCSFFNVMKLIWRSLANKLKQFVSVSLVIALRTV